MYKHTHRGGREREEGRGMGWLYRLYSQGYRNRKTDTEPDMPCKYL